MDTNTDNYPFSKFVSKLDQIDELHLASNNLFQENIYQSLIVRNVRNFQSQEDILSLKKPSNEQQEPALRKKDKNSLQINKPMQPTENLVITLSDSSEEYETDQQLEEEEKGDVIIDDQLDSIKSP
eukprot:CAMPEP_0170550160 /NCGR_PEP_ID=MMETSP0211-20121228/8228_1 /TAXON_ID=311385 /ORGANISM="Pseudokeronopsis sp., Strain OXSARD2" /LENGTH=125 /DNA_ID=CAMNT_0010856547 /DNA_START=3153 /DNA_END=3530 /DNA_ORIENTATION=+